MISQILTSDVSGPFVTECQVPESHSQIKLKAKPTIGHNPQPVTICSTTLFTAAGNDLVARGKNVFGPSHKGGLANHLYTK